MATDVRKFARLEAARRSFGVPPEEFDQCAKLLSYHYHRASDCYLSRDAWLEAVAADRSAFH